MEGDPDWKDLRALLPLATAAVYGAALVYTGASFWRAVAVGIAVLIAIVLNCGRLTLMRGGVIIVFVALAMWAGAEPQKWLVAFDMPR
jgi:hypothetical protein